MSLSAGHLSVDTIAGLCEGLLPEMEQCFAEDHLAECEACRGIFERMDALVYRGFSAESHAAAIRREAYAADPLVRALRDTVGRQSREGRLMRSIITNAIPEEAETPIWDAEIKTGEPPVGPTLMEVIRLPSVVVQVANP